MRTGQPVVFIERAVTRALAALHSARLRVPQDVALVGYDDMPWASLCDPPLTVVQQPTRELGSHRCCAVAEPTRWHALK